MTTPVPISRAYGLDRSGDRILLARWARGRAKLLAAAPSGDPGLLRALADARAEVAAGRAAWAVASPPEATFLKELQTPIRSRAKAARVWGGLLDLELPTPLDELSWTLVGDETTPDGCRAVVAAMETREVRGVLERWRAEGVEATHLDAFPAALFALLPAAGRGVGYRVAVWLGDRAVAVAGGVGGSVRSFHMFRAEPGLEGDFIARFAARAPHLLDLERGPAIHWAGPGSASPELVGALEKALRDAGATARFGVLPGGESALACKLAERAARGCSLQLAPPDAVPGAWREHCRRLVRRWRCAAVAAAIAVIAACGFILHSRAARLERVHDELADAAADIAGKKLPRNAEVTLLSSDSYAQKWKPRKLAFERLGPAGTGIAPALREIFDAAQNAGVDVAACELSGTGFTLSFPGDTPGEAIDSVAGTLRGARWTVERFADGEKRPALKGVRP